MTNDHEISVIFFDVRDTLGEVDRPGHLVPYRPSTEKLLSEMKNLGMRIGVITNLPDDLSAHQGRQMLTEAVLSEDEKTGQRVRLIDFLDPEAIIINHEAGASKPDPAIFRYAANKLGVSIESCLFSGENLIEVLGARAAGMNALLKPCPPGREFLPAVISRLGKSAKESGRAFEAFLEHEHLLGERIFDCGAAIVKGLQALNPGDQIPNDLHTAIAILVYLTTNFADQAHLKAEEAIIPLAIARGMDPKHAEWVLNHHDQARAYWRAMEVAWRRIEGTVASDDDRAYAIADFWRCSDAFVTLFKHHAVLENDVLYPEMGKYFSDTDDTLIINLISHIGPADFTPYVGLVAAMERALGVPSPDS